jgi:hypothetical protein
LDTVICTWTGPYWVFSLGPVKVPDGFGGAELFVGAGAAGGVVGSLGGAVVGVVRVGAAVCVLAGFLGAAFFAVLDGDALAKTDAEAVGDALIVGAAGDVLATAMPAT